MIPKIVLKASDFFPCVDLKVAGGVLYVGSLRWVELTISLPLVQNGTTRYSSNEAHAMHVDLTTKGYWLPGVMSGPAVSLVYSPVADHIHLCKVPMSTEITIGLRNV